MILRYGRTGASRLRTRSSADDARLVEAAYQTILHAGHRDNLEPVEFATSVPLIVASGRNISPNLGRWSADPCPSHARRSNITPIKKPIRRRNKAHLIFVAAQPCLICKRSPCDAHHLKFAQPQSLGRKVSDEFTVPLCREHHHELHRQGNEMAWWANLRMTSNRDCAGALANQPRPRAELTKTLSVLFKNK